MDEARDDSGIPAPGRAPHLARPALLRERLLGRLVERWSRPITVVTAGAGFGKTTLLVQAVSENELDPRGTDCWVTCREHHRVAASLASTIVQALGEVALHGGATGDSSSRIVDVMRSRAPAHVCLVLDDAHEIDRASPGARLLEQLLEDLPSNAHVLFAGRTDPGVALARRRATGLVNDLVESDLAFTDDELRAFTTLRVATPGSVAAAGGWPALAELLATTNRAVAEAFLWDEVLARFDDARRRGLAMLQALGGADNELISAAFEAPIDVVELTRSVPMTSVTDRGWATVHDLWAPALTRILSGAERRGGCLRAADVARERGDYAQAVRLYGSAHAFDDVRALARRVCADSHPLVPAEVLSDWHALLVERGYADSAEAALLAGAARKPADPLGSVPYFELAASRFAERGDIDGEMAAIFHLGHIAWWHENYDLMARLLQRGTALAAAGSALAASIVTLGPLVIAEVMGDSAAVIDAVRTASRDHQHAEIVPITDYLETRAHLTIGDPASALAPARRALAAATPTMKPPAEFELLSCLWALGHVDDVLGRVGAAIADLEDVAWLHNRAANGAQAALWCCLGGQPETARSMLARAQLVREAAGNWARALVALAEVTLSIDRGDEAEAARLLREELDVRGLDDPAVARAHRSWVALTYVLDPQSRMIWDALPLAGTVRVGRACARAIVALREGTAVDTVDLRNADASVVRPQVPTPWLAEVAVALAVDGQVALAEEVLGGSNHRGLRASLRALSKHRQKSIASAASSLLSSRAAPPAHALRLSVLGPLQIEFDGEPASPVQLNRKAVRDLLLLLVDRHSISRAHIRALLWPDLDDDGARNNLRVTLSYLLQALQPERQSNEQSYFIEEVAEDLRIRPGAAFALDVVEFDEALSRAAESERRGAISLARDELERAVHLYRGEYLASASEAEWAHAPRERLRLRFVQAAVRAGELALASGQVETASELALRAIGSDPWSEPARRLLAEARLAGADRSGALRALDDCAVMLHELGVGPEPATRMLARRMGFARFD